MNPTRRANLIRALDIDIWTRRGQSSVELPPLSEQKSIRTEAAEIDMRKPLTDCADAKFPVSVSTCIAPSDWPGLADAVAGCTRCKLCRTRTKTVFGVGPKHAPLMVIGEGPGADEDAQGEPFVGRAGKLLDEMLKAIGRSRADNTYIANVVKCRPPGNRDPEAEEVAACRPYLDRQIELIKPKLIVALGRIAAQRLLATDAPLSKLRGSLHEYGDAKTPVLITYHPAYLLRSPGEKAKSWADLKRVHRFLAEQTGN